MRIPPLVAEYLSDPPCNYHRQDAFREMFAATESDLKSLLGVARPDDYFATQITSTGTGANEAALLALATSGKGLIICNGFFGARLVDQAVQSGLDHVVLDAPHDRPIDPDAVRACIDANPGLTWAFFVSHETRMGLKNPIAEIGRVCKEKGLLVGADCISSSYAYPIDIEAAQLDIATSSSAKALRAAPGIGIAFVKLDSIPAMRRTRAGNYYLDILSELEKQRAESQPRFAQPVALHAAMRAACMNLNEIGIEAHHRRIRSQMDTLIEQLSILGVDSMLDPAHRSWIAVNFRLPGSISYGNFSSRMIEEGYFVLYGIPGDDTHFQLSTIGDLSTEHIDGICRAFSRIFEAGVSAAGAATR